MHSWMQKSVFISYAGFTVLTAILWLVMPDKLSQAIAQAASAYAIDVGRARGASDLALGIIAWNARNLAPSPGRQFILLGLFAANVLLLVAGTIAQLTSISTPSRWIVYLAHVGWACAFGYYFVRGGWLSKA